MWTIKKFSESAGVSVKSLYHYDKIGLLKPSLRGSNRYRFYLKEDLEKLQQITMLKEFGFALKEIKSLLAKKMNAFEALNKQALFLGSKIKSLTKLQKNIESVLFSSSEEISINQIFNLIREVNMSNKETTNFAKELLSNEMEKSLSKVKSSCTQDYLKNFNKELLENFDYTSLEGFDRESLVKSMLIGKLTGILCADISRYMNEDPKGAIAKILAQHYVDLCFNSEFETNNLPFKDKWNSFKTVVPQQPPFMKNFLTEEQIELGNKHGQAFKEWIIEAVEFHKISPRI